MISRFFLLPCFCELFEECFERPEMGEAVDDDMMVSGKARFIFHSFRSLCHLIAY